MKFIEAVQKQKEMFYQIGRPQTVKGVYDRMILSILQPRHKDAYKFNCVCHSVAINYVDKRGKTSDMLVMVGKGNTVYHSFVANFRGEIIADSNIAKNPTFDGKYYTVDNKQLKLLWNRPVKKIEQDIKGMEGVTFV